MEGGFFFQEGQTKGLDGVFPSNTWVLKSGKGVPECVCIRELTAGDLDKSVLRC